MATEFPITEVAAEAVSNEPNVGQLSFVGRRPDDSGANLWNPGEVPGGWIEQVRRGRSYGHEAVEYIREAGDCAMLQGVVHAMAQRGTFGGVEAGFFGALSASLLEPA